MNVSNFCWEHWEELKIFAETVFKNMYTRVPILILCIFHRRLYVSFCNVQLTNVWISPSFSYIDLTTGATKVKYYTYMEAAYLDSVSI